MSLVSNIPSIFTSISLASLASLSSSVRMECGFFNGRIDTLGVACLGAYKNWDETVLPRLKSESPGVRLFPKSSPELLLPTSTKIVDLSFFLETRSFIWVSNTENSQEFLNRSITSIFNEAHVSGLFHFGPHGDIVHIMGVKISENELCITVGNIFQKSFPKPALASDLALVVKGLDTDGSLKHALISGIRLNEPGKGGPAFFGGFRDLSMADGKQHFLSGIFAAIKEGREEGGIQVSVPNAGSYIENYDADKINVNTTIQGCNYPAEINYVGTIKTSDAALSEGGEMLSDGTKRVHATSCYTCVIDVGGVFASLDLFSAFTAGDDITGIIVTDISEAVDSPASDLDLRISNVSLRLGFGIQHHNTLLQMVVKKLHCLNSASSVEKSGTGKKRVKID
jgi:hypothetical protein